MSDRKQTVLVNDTFSDEVDVVFGVPQGSVLGPELFLTYTKRLLELIDRRSVLNQSFADDTQLYKSCTPAEIPSTILNLQECIESIREWMACNKLKLNDDKTEALLFHTQRSIQSFDMPDYIYVGTSQVKFSSSARNLGYTISNTMSLELHVTNVCRSAYLALRQISSIRQFLSEDATKKLVCSFVLSRLDYCNSMLSGCPKYLVDRLQKVQNSAARLVFKTKKRQHVTPLLKTLHWLPIQARIDYKLSVLCHNYISGSAPEYFGQLLTIYTPSRQLRSSADDSILVIPKVRTKTFGERSFLFCASRQWNSLPLNIRSIQSITSFKAALKTYLFNNYY